MKKILTFSGIALFFLGVSFTSCDKIKDTITALDSDNQEAVVDCSSGEQSTNDGFDIANDALNMKGDGLNKTNGFVEKILTSCAVITYDNPKEDSATNKWPKYLTVKFGNGAAGAGCLGKDGRTRKGMIKIQITNRFRIKDAKVIVDFVDFSVNGNKVEGKITVTNIGLDSDGNMSWQINVDNAKFTKSDNGKTATWTTSKKVTEMKVDNIVTAWKLSGSGSGISGSGKEYTSEITKDIIAKANCAWVSEGQMKITIKGKDPINIDFGNGTCDNLVEVTLLGKTFKVEMAK